MNAAGDVILIIDRDFRIVWPNPSLTELTGYAEAEAVGKDPRVLLRSGLRDPEFYREVSATILRGESWRGEMTNRRKDGRLDLEGVLITPVKDDKGVVEYLVSLRRDLTAQREMEAHPRHAQKMEVVGQLWPALRVVLMSGYVEETMQESARRNRWRFLQKPFRAGRPDPRAGGSDERDGERRCARALSDRSNLSGGDESRSSASQQRT